MAKHLKARLCNHATYETLKERISQGSLRILGK